MPNVSPRRPSGRWLLAASTGVFAALLLLAAMPAPAAAQDIPTLTGRVTDLAGVLDGTDDIDDAIQRLELRRDTGQARPGVAQAEPGPPGEVAHGRGPVRGEEPASQHPQHLIPRRHLSEWCPLIQQRVGLLPPGERAARDECGELGVHHHIGEPGATCHDAFSLEARGQLVACQEVPARERALDDAAGSRQDSCVELELPLLVAVEAMDVGRGQREEPADVIGKDEVPGGAEDVGAEETALVEGAIDGGIGRALHSLPE